MLQQSQVNPSFLYNSIQDQSQFDVNRALIKANKMALHQMDNMNAENYTEKNIHVYEPVEKLVDGEMDYMQARTDFNVDQDPNADQVEVKSDVSNFVNLAPFPVEFKTPEDAL